MKRVLTVVIIGSIICISLSRDVLSCGMKSRGAVSMGGVCQNLMTHKEGDEMAADNMSNPVTFDENASNGYPLKLIKERCGFCHNPMTVFLSKKFDWSHTIHRMESYALTKNVTLLTDEERVAIVNYLNTYNSTDH